MVFLIDYLIFARDLSLLIEDLTFTYFCEFLGQQFALSKTIHKDEINHAYVGVEDGLEQDSSLDALD